MLGILKEEMKTLGPCFGLRISSLHFPQTVTIQLFTHKTQMQEPEFVALWPVDLALSLALVPGAEGVLAFCAIRAPPREGCTLAAESFGIYVAPLRIPKARCGSELATYEHTHFAC